jgi:hypothetical protein
MGTPSTRLTIWPDLDFTVLLQKLIPGRRCLIWWPRSCTESRSKSDELNGSAWVGPRAKSKKHDPLPHNPDTCGAAHAKISICLTHTHTHTHTLFYNMRCICWNRSLLANIPHVFCTCISVYVYVLSTEWIWFGNRSIFQGTTGSTKLRTYHNQKYDAGWGIIKCDDKK